MFDELNWSVNWKHFHFWLKYFYFYPIPQIFLHSTNTNFFPCHMIIAKLENYAKSQKNLTSTSTSIVYNTSTDSYQFKISYLYYHNSLMYEHHKSKPQNLYSGIEHWMIRRTIFSLFERDVLHRVQHYTCVKTTSTQRSLLSNIALEKMVFVYSTCY